MRWNEGNHDLIAALRAELLYRMEAGAAEALGDFAERFLRNLAAEDLAGRSPADLAAAMRGFWAFIQQFDGGAAKVEVFNPEPDRHGWGLGHTVIAVLCRDMPFALESVRAELNRRNLTIHTIHSLPFHAQRGAGQRLLELLPERAEPSDSDAEALLYLEINRTSDVSELQALKLVIEDVVAEVKMATDDFGAMLTRLDAVVDELEARGADALAEREIRDFLCWMRQGHFTFLGYESLRVDRAGPTPVLRRNGGHDLGLLRLRSSLDLLDVYRDIGSGDDVAELAFSKSSVRSRVHRRVYPDYVEVRIPNGAEVEVHRFLGLYTSRAYTVPTSEIPVVRRKVAIVMERSRLDPGSHEGSELARVLEIFPRDELFQSDVDELFNTAMGINQIQERRQVRLFSRSDRSGKFVSCLVFMPRDLYQTDLRQRIQNLLVETWSAVEAEFATFFSESILTRTQFILRVNPGSERDVDVRRLERRIADLTMSWEDHLRRHLLREFGEERGTVLANAYHDAFPVGYRDDYEPQVAHQDIRKIATLAGSRTLALKLYREPGDPGNELRFRLYHMGTPLVLSDVVPVLEHLGPIVTGERAYGIHRGDGKSVWIHEFALRYPGASQVEVEDLAELFQEAFARIWKREAESDRFNQLVPGALLSWREVSLLRAYARYLKQIHLPFSCGYIAETLGRHPQIARQLINLFVTRFDPDLELDLAGRMALTHRQVDELEAALEGVDNLAEDRVIRACMGMIQATVRSNYYSRTGGQAGSAPTLSFKFRSAAIADLPFPQPEFEIYVYSPRLEGVHLRGGKVARGGLRWSDRLEDFRTEVLGLFKAQQVKNAVIVPTGAKGGFVPRRIAADAERAEREAEGRACYRLFIEALLSVTDNLDGERIVPPDRVVRWDDDDPYLVVAADKGTASFSDLANEVAFQYRFWLGDAFASGGQYGYDHKQMGITARGAWVSVQRHFREFGIDVQTTPIDVVAIGDMGGDVFGNGMLCSTQIRLRAAFNHQHIFLDPDPEPAIAYRERQRLFCLQRSSWEDYDPGLISAGGGVYRRSLKSIPLTRQVQALLQIDADQLRPAELISAILRAPVDLLWNGGIGTYVKATGESHAEVGDKANDALRINGSELRCRAVGEGGNLGMTQAARIEYALAGGRCNTDFIDNSGGVDCSDHEVNLKIVLNRLVQTGDLTERERQSLLEQLTDEVARLVLTDNERQTLALSLAENDVLNRMGEYRRLLTRLENEDQLKRDLEALPSEDQLTERRARGQGLTRPELALLMCLVKSRLKRALTAALAAATGNEGVGDPYLAQALDEAFPAPIRERCQPALEAHRLRREIIATELANAVVNDMGITFVERMQQSTGADVGSIVCAYVAARDLFDLPALWRAATELEGRRNEAGGAGMESPLLYDMLAALVRLVRRGARWLLRNRRHDRLRPGTEVVLFHDALIELAGTLPRWLSALHADAYRERRQLLLTAGVPSVLAQRVALAPDLYHGLTIIDIADRMALPPERVAEAFYGVAAELELDWFGRSIAELKVDSYWQGLARETYRDDFERQLRTLTEAVLRRSGSNPIAIGLSAWLAEQRPLVERWRGMLAEIHAAETADLGMFAVASRELLELAHGSNDVSASGRAPGATGGAGAMTSTGPDRRG